MKNVTNKLYRNHSLFYKILLLIGTTFLIVYLFPKSGKFKYNFEKGKPWQSETLQAPFDFAIKKTDEETNEEKEKILFVMRRPGESRSCRVFSSKKCTCKYVYIKNNVHTYVDTIV